MHAEKLQKRRQQFEVEHKEELRVEKEQKASRAKQVETEVEQRNIIAHVLKQHVSHYDLLLVCFLSSHQMSQCFTRGRGLSSNLNMQIPETSSSADIGKAWKRLSKMVHPDRCKLPRGQEAFIKIKASVDALQATTV